MNESNISSPSEPTLEQAVAVLRTRVEMLEMEKSLIWELAFKRGQLLEANAANIAVLKGEIEALNAKLPKNSSSFETKIDDSVLYYCPQCKRHVHPEDVKRFTDDTNYLVHEMNCGCRVNVRKPCPEGFRILEEGEEIAVTDEIETESGDWFLVKDEIAGLHVGKHEPLRFKREI